MFKIRVKEVNDLYEVRKVSDKYEVRTESHVLGEGYEWEEFFRKHSLTIIEKDEMGDDEEYMRYHAWLNDCYASMHEDEALTDPDADEGDWDEKTLRSWAP